MQALDVNDKDEWGDTALILAVYGGSKYIVQFLLNVGADINAKNKKGITALMLAARKGHTDIVQLLKKHGAKE